MGHGFVLRRPSNRKSILDVHPDHFWGLSGVGNEETDQFGVPSVASQVDPLILIPALKPLGDSSHICMKIYCLKPSTRFLCWISCMTHQVALSVSNRCVLHGFKPPGDHWHWRGNTSIYLALLQWCWTNSPTHSVQKATPRIPLPAPMHRSSHSTGPKRSGNTPICGRMEQSSVHSGTWK